MHGGTCIHFLIGLTDLKLLHNSIIILSQFSRKNLGFSFSSLHSISSFSSATHLLVLDPKALKLQIAKIHLPQLLWHSGNNVWDWLRTTFPYAKPSESWSLPSDTQNPGFSSPRSSSQCKSQAIWMSTQSTARRPHSRAVLTILQLHSQRQEPRLAGTWDTPHAIGFIVSCCESDFDHIHLPTLLPAQNDFSSPQVVLCTCMCPHCSSSTFGIWTSSDCQQLQSAGTRGVPLEKAWKEPMGDSNSTWPKLVEHYLCDNLSHSSLKSCLQTQNTPSGKSADLCSPNNALLFFFFFPSKNRHWSVCYTE